MQIPTLNRTFSLRLSYIYTIFLRNLFQNIRIIGRIFIEKNFYISFYNSKLLLLLLLLLFSTL